MSIKKSIQNAPTTQKGDYTYIIHPLLDGVPRVDPHMLDEWIDWAVIQPMLDEATVLLAPEAMALPLATGLSLECGTPYLTARKRSYGLEGEVEVQATTGYSAPTLYLNDIQEGDKIVIIDDVLSTGGTLRSVLAALKELPCEVLGALILLDKGEAAQDIAKTYGIPVVPMIRARVDVNGVKVI